MREAFEVEHEDVLQNIEAAIIGVYRREPELLDYDVDAALEALISRYVAEVAGREPREHGLDGLRREVYDAARAMCEWRLGRQAMAGALPRDGERKTPDEVLACLRRIRRSVQRWTKQRGRQGYLDFVSRYV